MLLILTLVLLFFPASQNPPPHIPAVQLASIAKQIAAEEGWPIDQKGYTFDPMTPTDDDGFDSIGLYRNKHLVRMYSVDRTTGDVVDFMRGCDVFQFEDLKSFQAKIRSQTGAAAPSLKQLAVKAGCPRLTIVNTRWVQ